MEPCGMATLASASSLALLDFAFLFLHTALIFFNLLGWA